MDINNIESKTPEDDALYDAWHDIYIFLKDKTYEAEKESKMVTENVDGAQFEERTE